jgi:hypothetical protein
MRLALLVLVLFSTGCSTEPQQTKEFTVKVLTVESVNKPNGDSLIKATAVKEDFFHPVKYRLTLLCGGEDSPCTDAPAIAAGGKYKAKIYHTLGPAYVTMAIHDGHQKNPLIFTVVSEEVTQR